MKVPQNILAILIGTGVFLAICLVCYGGFAIGSDTLNFHAWGEAAKAVAGFLFVVAVILGIFAGVGWHDSNSQR
jgi:hypothetical protein